MTPSLRLFLPAIAIAALSAPASAGTFSLLGTATIVHNAPPPFPDAIRLTTTDATSFGTVLYDPAPIAIPFDQLTTLSTDLDMAGGEEVAQSPRITLYHVALDGSGLKHVFITLTPDVLNQWTTTGNLIDPNSNAPIWDLHELSDAPDAATLTYAEALGVLRGTSISFASIDLDAGAFQDQTLYVDHFNVNGDELTVAPVPEPASLTLLTAASAILLRRRRR
ncbi:MAG TPA: PEP-CTERM sorting domain-containing protein [Phycisphaerae bacterium]|nr:PEP-CTERM sorting domain-containing protein [Phycisphaerae bacterium]